MEGEQPLMEVIPVEGGRVCGLVSMWPADKTRVHFSVNTVNSPWLSNSHKCLHDWIISYVYILPTKLTGFKEVLLKWFITSPDSA